MHVTKASGAPNCGVKIARGGKARAMVLRRLSLWRLGWLFLLALYVSLFSLLLPERNYASGGSLAVVHARQVIAEFFGSSDAPANLEHACFGIFSGLTGYLIWQLVLSAAAPSLPPLKWPRTVRRWGREKLLRRKTPLRIPDPLELAARNRLHIRRMIRWWSTSRGALLVATATGIGWLMSGVQFNGLDFLVALAMAAVVACLMWHFGRVVRSAIIYPWATMMIAALLMLAHWEVVWKIQQVGVRIDSVGHALRHLALSGVAAAATTWLLTRLSRLRRVFVNGALALLAACAAAAAIAMIHSPPVNPFGTKGFAISGAKEVRPKEVTFYRGQMVMFFQGAHAPVPYRLGDDGQLVPVPFTSRTRTTGQELIMKPSCEPILLKAGEKLAAVVGTSACTDFRKQWRKDAGS
jgi:hypothetical protein